MICSLCHKPIMNELWHSCPNHGKNCGCEPFCYCDDWLERENNLRIWAEKRAGYRIPRLVRDENGTVVEDDSIK